MSDHWAALSVVLGPHRCDGFIMSRDIRTIDADSKVTVETDDCPEAVYVRFEPSGITFVGSLTDLYRIIDAANSRLSREVTIRQFLEGDPPTPPSRFMTRPAKRGRTRRRPTN